MKIYILHEMSGYGDDYFDHIHSIYLNLDKAESVKSELELKSAQIDKCYNCVCSGYCIPDCECEEFGFDCDEIRIKYAKDNCDMADPYIDKFEQDYEGFQMLKCKNKIIEYSEDCRYRIEEKDVIE